MQLGDQLPNLTVPATSNQHINLLALQGRPVVLYFYPKDHTSACTQEGEAFRDHYAKFVAADAIILGVSRDGVRKHEKFKAEYQFPFDLLADTQAELCNLFNVLYPKTMFGKPAIGLERSTFLFDCSGILCQEWRKVKVEGHIAAVLAAVTALA